MVSAEIIRWSASVSGIIAAIIVALNLGRRATGLGFVVFTASSVTWILAGYMEDLPSLVTQNAVLTAVNGNEQLLALSRHQIVQPQEQRTHNVPTCDARLEL
jgi:hypothetical protein